MCGHRAGPQVSGDLGGEMAQHADKMVSGFIRTFERNYSRFEQAVKQAVRGLPPPAPLAGRHVGCISWLNNRPQPPALLSTSVPRRIEDLMRLPAARAYP